MSVIRSVLLIGLGISFTLSSWTVSQAQPTVYVVNYPLQYFAERIGAEQVRVVFPAPADEDPAFWKPDVETIAAFQAADLILINGAGYAKWLKTASLPKSKVIDTSRAFQGGLYRNSRHGYTQPRPDRRARRTPARPLPLGWTSARPHEQAQAGHGRVEPPAAGASGRLSSNGTPSWNMTCWLWMRRLDAIVAQRRGQPLLASHPGLSIPGQGAMA